MRIRNRSLAFERAAEPHHPHRPKPKPDTQCPPHHAGHERKASSYGGAGRGARGRLRSAMGEPLLSSSSRLTQGALLPPSAASAYPHAPPYPSESKPETASAPGDMTQPPLFRSLLLAAERMSFDSRTSSNSNSRADDREGTASLDARVRSGANKIPSSFPRILIIRCMPDQSPGCEIESMACSGLFPASSSPGASFRLRPPSSSTADRTPCRLWHFGLRGERECCFLTSPARRSCFCSILC